LLVRYNSEYNRLVHVAYFLPDRELPPSSDSDRADVKVLSIDAQRLELADVLATSGNQDPATQAVSTEEPDDDRHILSWRGLLASRMFNSGTLVLVR
jgi:hypothetical protein